MRVKGIAPIGIVAIALSLIACAAPPAPTPTTAPKIAPPTATTAAAAPTAAPKAVATPAAAAPTPAPKATAAPKTLTKVKVSYTALSGQFWPVWLAQEQKLYQKNGLEVELQYIASSTTAMQAMLSGEVPLSYGGSGETFVAASIGGADVIMIGALYNKVIMYFFGLPSVSGPADIKGKTVGVSRFGSQTDGSARFALRKMGLDPEKDVTLLQMGGVPEILAGLIGGSIVAGPLSPPNSFKALDSGFKELMDIGAAGLEYSSPVVTTRAFLRNNSATALAFLRSVIEGTYVLKTNKAVSMEVLGKYTKTDDKKTLEGTYAAYVDKAEKIPYVSREALMVAIEQVARENEKAKGANPDSFYDMQFVKQIEDSGFIKQLYKE
ncbi:MAG: ABC transporter substrate-binding protein [Chloroflexi bacterium]|nr:ABC transporter substrate-binding protein [Chloroflexota bacterium]